MTSLNLDMDSNDLHDWIVANGPVQIVFSAGAENFESYPEKGIQAIITEVCKNEADCYRWMLDYTQFEVSNTLHETKTYYGSAPDSPGHLSAYAAKHYKRKDFIYITPEDKLSNFLTHIQPEVPRCTKESVEQRFEEMNKVLGGFSI